MWMSMASHPVDVHSIINWKCCGERRLFRWSDLKVCSFEGQERKILILSRFNISCIIFGQLLIVQTQYRNVSNETVCSMLNVKIIEVIYYNVIFKRFYRKLYCFLPMSFVNLRPKFTKITDNFVWSGTGGLGWARWGKSGESRERWYELLHWVTPNLVAAYK